MEINSTQSFTGRRPKRLSLRKINQMRKEAFEKNLMQSSRDYFNLQHPSTKTSGCITPNQQNSQFIANVRRIFGNFIY